MASVIAIAVPTPVMVQTTVMLFPTFVETVEGLTDKVTVWDAIPF